MFLRSQLLIARRTSWYRTHGSRLTAPLTLVYTAHFFVYLVQNEVKPLMPTPPVYSSTACNGFTRTRRSSKSGIPSRRIKISLLLARRKAAQKASAGLPKFVHVVCVTFAWLKGDTNNQGQESKRTNRCTSTPQETPKKTWVQQGPSYTKYDTCTGFDRNETASAEKKQEYFLVWVCCRCATPPVTIQFFC